MARTARSVLRWRIRRDRLRWPSARQGLAALLAVCALGGIAFGLTRVRMDTGTDAFLPSGDPALAALDQKARAFGGDPVVVLLRSKTPRQLLLDQDQLFRLLALEGTLARTANVAAVYGPATVVNQVAASAQNLLAQIGGRRDGLRRTTEAEARKKGKSAAEAKAAADAAVAKFDLRYGSLLVRGLPAGMPTLYNAGFVRAVVFDSDTGMVRPQWSFVVPNPDTVAISIRPREGLDQAGDQRLVADVRAAVARSGLAVGQVTVSGVPAVTAGLARRVTAELPLLAGLVALAVALRFLVVPAGVRIRHRLWPPAAALAGTLATVAVFGLTGRPLSFGAVALLPILLGVGSSIPLYLAVLRDTRRVVTMSLASAAGFASLAVSPLPVVRELGFALAGGVLLTTLTALALRKSLGGAEPGPASGPAAKGPVAAGSPVPAKRAPARGGRLAVALAVTALAAVGWLSLPRLTVQADPQQLLRGLPELASAQRAQRVLGSSGEVSVVLTGPDATGLAALAWSRQAEQIIVTRYGDRLRPVLTAPDLLRFLGGDPTEAQLDAALGLLPPYLRSAVISSNSGSAVMIFGVGLQDVGRQAALIENVRKALPPAPAGFSVRLVGLPVAAERGYELISAGRYAANLAGIAAAGVVLAIGLRRRTEAVRAVLAALLATGWSLAALWLAGGSLSPLTVALGSLTTVTGSEFLVLLADADVRASRRLRRSVALACLTSAIGYCALAASELSVLRNFGLVLTGTVVLSYAAARVVLWVAPVAAPASPSPSPSPGLRAGPGAGPRAEAMPDRETVPAQP